MDVAEAPTLGLYTAKGNLEIKPEYSDMVSPRLGKE
jgi:hypothetical protein